MAPSKEEVPFGGRCLLANHWPIWRICGLIDELHVITVPGLVGGIDTPSIIDGPGLEAGSLPTRLRTVDVKVGSHGSIWADYEVIDESRPMNRAAEASSRRAHRAEG